MPFLAKKLVRGIMPTMNIRYLFAALLLLPLAVHGETDMTGDSALPPGLPMEQPAAVKTTDHGVMSFLASLTHSNQWNKWHATLCSNVVQMATRMDNFFADDRLNEEGNDTRVNLSLGIRLKEGEDAKAINRLNVRLSLPNLSRRIQLVLEDMVESDDPNRPRGVLDDIANSRPDAAIRYTVKTRRKTRVSGDAGVRLGSSDQVFLRLRANRDFDVAENYQIRLTESVRWYSVDGWISSSQIQVNHWVGSAWLFRSATDLDWEEYAHGVTPSQTFSAFRTFSRRRALRLDIGGTWPESPNTREARYFTTITHRRLVHSNWLFMQVAPGVEFPEQHGYDPKFYVSIQFDMIIGNIKD